MKKNRDVKFIIYQSLYIFVVCVVAIKGANLDLVQVIDPEGKHLVRISEDSVNVILEMLKKSIMVDTQQFVVVPKELLAQNERLREIVQNMPKLDLNAYMPKVDMSQYVLKTEVPPIKEEEIKDPGEMQEIRIGHIELGQYTVNTLNNPYDTPLEIVGVVTIPPKSSKSFELGGQSTVTIRVGNTSKTVNCTPNTPPKIGTQRIASMGEDARVSILQGTVCYRVIISDDHPEQLKVSFSGPITVKDVGKNTYDVTLNAFGSRSSFEAFTDGKDSPYALSGVVTVSDPISGHKTSASLYFSFGEW
jgi:hypothetical protein